MPKITKSVSPSIQNHQPTVTSLGTIRAGSVLSEAIPISQLKEDWIRLCLYGVNRTGKTTLACQFPKPLLLLALEPNKTGGAQSVKLVKNVTYLRLDNTIKIAMLAEELRENNPFQTVVIDSATSLQDIHLKEILNLSAVPEQLSWGMVSDDQYRQRSEKTRESLRPFLNLDCNTVIIAKEKDHNPPANRKAKIVKGPGTGSFFAANLGGATVEWLHDACDCICQLYVEKEVEEKKMDDGSGGFLTIYQETGGNVRKLRTLYDPMYAAGLRSCTPDKVPQCIVDPTFEKLLKVIKGE